MEYPYGATPLSLDEIDGLRYKHITTRSELDHIEQANIQHGISWMRKSKRTVILSEAYVCDLHKKLFGEVWEWAGTFRRTGKNIGVDPLHISVELRMLLDDTAYWVKHNTYPPLEAAIRFHHRMVFIHPFPNGNGRHARIMADALLLKIYKLPTIAWAKDYSLREMNERRKEYIEALKRADRGDFTPLLVFAGIQKTA